MIYKHVDPINWVFSSLSTLLGGVFFPIAVLTGCLQTISYLLSLTNTLIGMRNALLLGYSLGELSFEIMVLVLFCSILVPLTVFSFRYAVKIPKKEEILAQY